MSVRFANECDICRVSELERLIFTSPWSTGAFESALEDDNAIFMVNTVDDDIASYGIIYVAADEAELPTIGCAPDSRRMGLTDELLRNLLACAGERGVRKCFLEVRKSNEAAIAMYEKHGFCKVGLRSNFYAEPVEDAYIMASDINLQ